MQTSTPSKVATAALILAVIGAALGLWAFLSEGTNAPQATLETAPDASTTPDAEIASGAQARHNTSDRKNVEDASTRHAANAGRQIYVCSKDDGSPIAGATVQAWQMRESYELVIDGQTDAHGYIDASGLHAGRFSMQITAPGYTERRYGTGIHGAAVVDVMRVELTKEAKLRVLVRDAGGSPYTRASVRLGVEFATFEPDEYLEALKRTGETRLLKNPRPWSKTLRTNDQGFVDFDGIPAGSHEVAVYRRKPRGKPSLGKLAISTSLRTNVGISKIYKETLRLEAGEERTITVTLEQRLDFSVIVRAHGLPLIDGRVSLPSLEPKAAPNPFRQDWRSKNQHSFAAVRTLNKSGEAKFTNIRPAKRTITVWLGEHNFPHSKVIDLSQVAQDDTIVFDIEPATLNVTIEKPDPKIHLTHFALRSGERHTSVRLFGKTTLRLEGLAAGTYLAEIGGRNVLPMQGVPVTLYKNREQHLRIALPPAVKMTVRVTGMMKRGIVRWRLPGRDPMGIKRMNKGIGEIELTAGTWLLEGRKYPGGPGYGPERKIVVQAGFPRTIDLTPQPDKPR